jgi:hypothetical protein
VLVWLNGHRWVISIVITIAAIPLLLGYRYDPWLLFFLMFGISVVLGHVNEPRARWPYAGAVMLAVCAVVWVAEWLR